MEKPKSKKVAEVYSEALRIVRKDLESKKGRSDITADLSRMIKEVVDRED